ncbi:MAG: COP9 signalosome (CSN) subunit [Vezdaea aestivalis]|nr:MAG: COP9 signalosome (CSN) subunit [Vezdaea aestivalis]
MDDRLIGFISAYSQLSGPLLAATIDPYAPGFPSQHAFSRSTNAASVRSDLHGYLSDTYKSPLRSNIEADGWVEIFASLWSASGAIAAAEDAERAKGKADWARVFDGWKEVVTAMIRGYTHCEFEAWTVPCLYVVGRCLRTYAAKADRMVRDAGVVSAGFLEDVVEEGGKNERLEEAARMINRIFQICLSDRAPLDESRKWGIYYTTNLLFRTYFKLNSISLCKNILRALAATNTDLPPLSAFPKSHQVTYKYYLGVIHFLEEDYKTAEKHLTEAYSLCPLSAHHNCELILTYLIPCRLLTSQQLPSPSLLASYPRLRTLFTPLSSCIKLGNLSGFDAALSKGEAEFVRRRIYLTLERGRDIALRNLLRKVFLEGGMTKGADGALIRRTRIPVREFGVAIGLGQAGGRRRGGEETERDEVECLLAGMIYKNFMKGYIAREHGIVVLSKTAGAAFPGTGV